MTTDLDTRLRRIESAALLGAKNVLSLKDAALLTGRSEKTIRRRLNEIPHHNGPLGIVFLRNELERWMCTGNTANL